MANAHMNMTPLSSAPTDNLQTNDVYLDDGTNTATGKIGFRYYNGTTWVDIAAPASSTLYIQASDMYPTTTGGSAALAQSETTTNKVNYQTFDFDQTVQENVNFTYLMPDDWDGGTVTFKAIWTAASGSGDVIWGLKGIDFADSTPLDTAFGTAQTVTDTLLTAEDVHVSAVSSAITLAGSPAAGDLVIFDLFRDANAGGDTLNADARLIGIKINYTLT